MCQTVRKFRIDERARTLLLRNEVVEREREHSKRVPSLIRDMSGVDDTMDAPRVSFVPGRYVRPSDTDESPSFSRSYTCGCICVWISLSLSLSLPLVPSLLLYVLYVFGRKCLLRIRSVCSRW